MIRRLLTAASVLSLVLCVVIAIASTLLLTVSYSHEWSWDQTEVRGDLSKRRIIIRSIWGQIRWIEIEAFPDNGPGKHEVLIPGKHCVFGIKPAIRFQEMQYWFGHVRKQSFDTYHLAGIRLGISADPWGSYHGLFIPYWIFFVLAQIPFFGHWRRRRKRLHIRDGCCPKCGYDLRASKERCPECGTVITASKRETA
jgi:hypothetical protein